MQYLTREHSWFALASASTMLRAEASSMKSTAQDVMSNSGIGQSETKWLKRAGELMDSCGTTGPPPALGTEASGAADRCKGPSYSGGMPQATSLNCVLSRKWWIISMRRRWEAVSNALEKSTAMAIVLLGGLHWLKPESTLAEMGSRADVVECLGLKPCWEGSVPSASTMDGRRSRSNIFTAWQSSEMGR